jgi:hypothetical protein
MAIEETRQVCIAREYAKGTERRTVLVATVTGANIIGTLYQYEEWHNNREKCYASGNKYDVRRKFVNRLMDLDEHGWKKKKSSGDCGPDQRFFDISEL